MKHQNQQAIVTAMRQCDQAGLEAYIDAYSGYLYTIIRHIAGSFATPEDMEECAADCIVCVWRNAEKIKEGCLKSYTAAVARNSAIDLRRKLTRRPFLPLHEDILFVDGEPGKLAEEAERQLAVRNAVNSFGEPDKEIFLRRYWLGEGLRSIAGAVHLTERAVEARLRRGRKKLCAQLEGEQ